MNSFVDIATNSINKFGEELCGDKVEIIKNEDSIIIVLSDGLGSGVKANILATMTSKIAATMLKEGASIEATVDTIVKTLPECKVRKLAYSTFSIIKIDDSGQVYIVEYDNPSVLIYRNGIDYPIDRQEKKIGTKTIKESHFELKKGDMISLISDGAIHAGVGALLNLGWQWDSVNDYLRDLNNVEKTANAIAGNFISVCNNLYDDHPGDDTTIVTVKVRDKEEVELFTGPPLDKTIDHWIVDNLIRSTGKKVICGGTTANIASRELKRDIIVDLDSYNKDVPPMAYMDGFDLITEGVLTLKATLEKLKSYDQQDFNDIEAHRLSGNDGATKLANLLINHCTHLNLWVGKAINPAHQNPNLPMNLNIKLQIVKELIMTLQELGKEVQVTYL